MRSPWIHELHCDHLGTPRVITNGSTGLVEGVQTFAPYGELLNQSGYIPLIGFTGHLQTESNGLIYMKARFYSPAWHCFLSPDPGGDPNQWSLYAYAGGNPLVNVDPSGMSWVSDWLGDVKKAVHQAGHAMGVNWNHGLRSGVEYVGAAVVTYFAWPVIYAWAGEGFVGGFCAGAACGAFTAAVTGSDLRGVGRAALLGGTASGIISYYFPPTLAQYDDSLNYGDPGFTGNNQSYTMNDFLPLDDIIIFGGPTYIAAGGPVSDSEDWQQIANNYLTQYGNSTDADQRIIESRLSDWSIVSLKDADHYMFARSLVENNRFWAFGLGPLIPLRSFVKVPGYFMGKSATPASFTEMCAGYKGIFDGLSQ